MIVEGVATTWDANGVVNVAPLGPIVRDSLPTEWRELVLRPFPGSRTYANLKATREGVFHLTDDVRLIAQSAVGDVKPPLIAAERVNGRRLAGCCRWFEFHIASWDETGERPQLKAVILHQDADRPWTGFNRAKHAVLEAAILTTRVHLLGKASVQQEFERLRVPVEKTAGPREQEAFAFLVHYIDQWSEG